MSSQITYDIDPTYGCWLWTGKLGGNGRPIVWRGKKPTSAHVLTYADDPVYGEVPDDHVLDHLCRRVLCVRPLHLEPVTRHENELRKNWSYRFRRTKCPLGHDMSTAMVTPEGGRLCRQCRPGVTGSSDR